MFDPYRKWLQIPDGQRPPTYYQLLGISRDENDPQVIEEAALMRTGHIRNFQNSKHSTDCIRILNEIAEAQSVLLDPGRRQAYDATLAACDRDPPANRPPTPPARAKSPIPPIPFEPPIPTLAPQTPPSAKAIPLPWIIGGSLVGVLALVAILLFAVSGGKPVRTSKKAPPDNAKQVFANSSLEKLIGENTLDANMTKWKTLAERAVPNTAVTPLAERKYASAQQLQSLWDEDVARSRREFQQQVTGLRQMYDELARQHSDRTAKIDEWAQKAAGTKSGNNVALFHEQLNKERMVLGVQDKELAKLQEQIFQLERDADRFKLEDSSTTREIGLLQQIERSAITAAVLTTKAEQRAEELLPRTDELGWAALKALARTGKDKGANAAIARTRQPDLADDKVIELCHALLASPAPQAALGVALGLRAHPNAVRQLDVPHTTTLSLALLSQDDADAAQAAEWLMTQDITVESRQLRTTNVAPAALARPSVRARLIEWYWQGGRDQKLWVIEQLLGKGAMAKLDTLEAEAREQSAVIANIIRRLSTARDVPASTNYAVTVDGEEVANLPAHDPNKWANQATTMVDLLERVKQAKTNGAPALVTDPLHRRLTLLHEVNNHYVTMAKLHGATFSDSQRRVALREIKLKKLRSWGFSMTRQHKTEYDKAMEPCNTARAALAREVPPYLGGNSSVGLVGSRRTKADSDANQQFDLDNMPFDFDGVWVSTHSNRWSGRRTVKGDTVIDFNGTPCTWERKGVQIIVTWPSGGWEKLEIDFKNPNHLKGRTQAELVTTWVRRQ